ncbi:MAG: TraI domain-containing protein [Clostridia bacterium]|nr:TraI domain-containing protein [Clostridia bacterium]
MKEQLGVADFIKNMSFEGFLLVKNAQQRSSMNGSKYLDMTLCDTTGEINAKRWDATELPPEVGEVLKVRGMVLEYNNRLQLRVDKMRSSAPADEVDINRLIPTAPRPSQDMLDDIIDRTDAMENRQLKELVLRMIDDAGDKLQTMPGAKNLHHAQKGGLLNHTTTMLRGAGFLCELYPFLDADLLAAGVIIHDLCKIDEMQCDALGLVTDYSVEGNLLGHIVMGVSKLDRFGREIGMDRELLVMLEHMVLAHHDLPEYGSPKPPMFPEAEALHILDLLDARMFEMKLECEKVNPGCFTERIWSLDRKLYRRSGRLESSTNNQDQTGNSAQ